MQNIFIDILPPWVETGLQPAFYDLESGTVLQQTARMYAKVRELNVAFNQFSEDVSNEINNFERETNTEIERFENATNEEIERFEGVVNDTVEEYIEKFNELHDYVQDYFDNLDVQEEINNKLDDMVEDGTLQEIITAYIQSNVAWTFDTVAEMKLSTNLVNGSYARTLGFYQLGDGGGAYYKISNTGTPNELDVIAIGSLNANLVKTSDTLNVKQVGVVGDGENDNYSQFVNLASVINGKGYTNVIFNAEHYMLSDQVDFDITTKNITIDFNGATIDYYPSTPFASLKALIDIKFPRNSLGTSSTIKHGSLTTSGIVPDWSDTDTYPAGSGRIIKCNARTAEFDDLHFENIFFGYAIDAEYCADVKITNCTGKDVGGRSSKNDYDSQGDAIYLGFSGVVYDENDTVDTTNSLPVNVLIENCNFRGYEAIEGSGTQRNKNHNGRCGVTLCEYSNTPQEKLIKINNCYFYNYQRGLHEESNQNVTVEVTNSTFEECATAVQEAGSLKNLSFTNCLFKKTINGIGIVDYYNALLNCKPGNTLKLAKFSNCRFEGYTGYISIYGGEIEFLFDNCKFAVYNMTAQTGGYITFRNCYIQANKANSWHKVITNIYDSYVELGYLHNSDSRSYWMSQTYESFDDSNKVQHIENNTFVNCSIRRIATGTQVYINNNQFTFDNNYVVVSGDNYFMLLAGVLREFTNNTVNNNTDSVFTCISGGGFFDQKVTIANNVFNGCMQGFYTATGFNAFLLNNRFNADGKTIEYGSDLTDSYVICGGNTYTGFTKSSPILNPQHSVCFNNYSISGNTATPIPS